MINRPASSQAQDRESSPVKDQRSTTVLHRQLVVIVVRRGTLLMLYVTVQIKFNYNAAFIKTNVGGLA